MGRELSENEFERLWRRMQHLGLNGYEARTYLVLVGHPQFKALDLATRARVPRQRIYEILDALVEKGFAHVVQEKTKLFSAVEPGLAISSYLARRRQEAERELTQQSHLASGVVDDLHLAYSEGREGRGTLDFLRILSDPSQAGPQFREMLAEVRAEYLEFSRPPYAAAPVERELLRQALERGVACRVLVEEPAIAAEQNGDFVALQSAGVDLRVVKSLPMKMAVFDGERGMIALLDPVITRPSWATVVFDHIGMGQAMKGLFADYWSRAVPPVAPVPQGPEDATQAQAFSSTS
ncbi:MAG: TrmB family transcriptional regulator [Bryobacteraceae bacterium]|nr:TrmB family transcriptional regulator [Bryobacteraceae bacterium]